MKQNRKTILYPAITVPAIVSLCCIAALPALAEKESISSKGNFEFSSGKAALYAEDIHYLQHELEKLFAEINH